MFRERNCSYIKRDFEREKEVREYAVHFNVRKGLGPEWESKTIFVGLDDIDHEMSEAEIRQLARSEAETQLFNTDDYLIYGKNWIYKDIEEI
jgi:hypothetical protein